mmetsp:Transcript_37770/g.92847  ORF Transcript_37770/g.92847 Transcript_37770/m.92847 type:complete len:210 (+) Transcript_37770:412-1041(+)
MGGGAVQRMERAAAGGHSQMRLMVRGVRLPECGAQVCNGECGYGRGEGLVRLKHCAAVCFQAARQEGASSGEGQHFGVSGLRGAAFSEVRGHVDGRSRGARALLPLPSGHPSKGRRGSACGDAESRADHQPACDADLPLAQGRRCFCACQQPDLSPAARSHTPTGRHADGISELRDVPAAVRALRGFATCGAEGERDLQGVRPRALRQE